MTPGKTGKSGMFFLPDNNTQWSNKYEKIMDLSIVINNGKEFVEKKDSLNSLIHEFAHFYHIDYLGISNPVIYNCYKFSQKKGLYTSHYSMVSPAEFFAEMSVFYFTERERFARLDKDNFAAVRFLWGEKQ
jgi:hypothetical protein